MSTINAASPNKVKFCFTYAIDGGAWVIFPKATEATWLSYAQIEKEMGKGWFEKMRAKQGMFTGCWVTDK